MYMSTGTHKCHHLWKEISFDLLQCCEKGHSYHFHPNVWKTEATREGSSWQRTYSNYYAAGSSALLCGRLTPAFFTLFVIAPLHPFLTSPQLRLCQTVARLEKGKQMGKQCWARNQEIWEISSLPSYRLSACLGSSQKIHPCASGPL